MSRILVTGKYSNPETYVLRTEDGNVFQTIQEGKPFQIDNQLRDWVPVKVPKRNGKGTLLVCRKFDKYGGLLEEFPLIHGKKGLWALTSGSARNGVFHNYTEPSNILEKILSSFGISSKLLECMETIDIQLPVGGALCEHTNLRHGYRMITDGCIEDCSQPERVPMDHPLREHRGCMSSTYTQRVTNASYLVYYEIRKPMYWVQSKTITRIIVTPKVDPKALEKAIREFFPR